MPTARSALVLGLLFSCAMSAHADWICKGTWRGTDGSSRTYDGYGPTKASAQRASVLLCRPNPMANCGSTPQWQCDGEDAKELTGGQGPAVQLCVPPSEISTPQWSGTVQELFGEQTGKRESCITTAPGQRVKKVACITYRGYAKDAPKDMKTQLAQQSCNGKQFNTSACQAGHTAIHETKSLISPKDEHIVCVAALGEKDSGNRVWLIVGGE